MISYNDLIEVEYNYLPGQPSNRFCHPDYQSEDEPPELEIQKIYVGEYQIYPKMDEAFLSYIEQMCEADVQDRIRQDEEDRAESRYYDRFYDTIASVCGY